MLVEKTKLHLGSIMGLYNEAGTMEQENSYDAWGKRRIVETWNSNVSFNTDNFLTVRGYTSHEHLDKVNLINMPACRTLGRNGRLYSLSRYFIGNPLTARMLSPDPFVQSPDYTQSYNRYSYCMNNPLKYTDPSGYYYFYDFNGRQDSKDVFAWIDIADGHEGDNISAGALGYTYQDGKYMDKATGEIVNFNEVYSYIIDNALKENPGNVKTVDPQYYNDLKNGYKLFSFKIFNRTELVLSNGTPELTGSNKLGYYINTTAGTIPLNQYFHINDLELSGVVQTIGMISNVADIVMDIVEGTIQNTQIGASFAYTISGSSNLVKVVSNAIQSAPYVGLVATSLTGYYLSKTINPVTNQPYQSWAETGTDFGANIGTIYIGAQFGGWWGAGASLFYVGLKYAHQESMEHYINNDINPGMLFIINKD